MIGAYGPTESAFTSLGIGPIAPSSCIVKEEINGIFEVEIRHPRDEGGKHKRLVAGNFVLCPTHRGDQAFRLYRVELDVMGDVRAYGRHVFYDLAQNMVQTVTVNGATAQVAGSAILAGCLFASGFSFSSALTPTYSATFSRINPVQAILGTEGSMVSIWGGEVERNGKVITLRSRLGADNGVRIAYAKNLTGLVVTTDMTGVVTRYLAVARAADGSDLYLPEVTIDSSLIGNYPLPFIRVLDCSDVEVGAEGYPTTAEVYAEMRRRVALQYAANVDLPLVSMDVNFVEWGTSAEYAGYSSLYTLALGDTITIEHQPLGISVSTRIVRVEYDAMLGRYAALTAGQVKPTLSQVVSAQTRTIASLKAAADEVAIDLPKTIAGLSTLDQATVDLNKTMATSMGYYVTVITNPTTGAKTSYIHDLSVLENSSIIYTMTAQGFAWTNAGWNGGAPVWQYGYTASGNLVSNVISTVGLVADWIQAGELRSATGRISFGLTSEVFRLGAHILDISTGGLRFTSSQHDESIDYQFMRSGGDKVIVLIDGTGKVTDALAWGANLRGEVRTDATNEGVDFVF